MLDSYCNGIYITETEYIKILYIPTLDGSEFATAIDTPNQQEALLVPCLTDPKQIGWTEEGGRK